MFFKRWQFIAGIFLLLASTFAQAASLGRVRGTALLGRGLDVSLQLNLDANESLPEAGCFAIEIFYGDTRISPSSVNVTSERSTNNESRIRIRSSLAVDEPVVTVFVKAGCSVSLSRRYVLLAEALSEAEPAQTIPSRPAIASSPIIPPAAAPRTTSVPVEELASTRSAPKKSATQRTAPQRLERQETRQNQAPVATVEPKSRASAQSKKVVASRLQVDLLDLSSTNLSLRGSNEMASLPTTDQAIRSQALALWRVLNLAPEDAMREQQRMGALELQKNSALEQNKRFEKDIAKLSSELQVAQSERYVNPLTITLGLLSLAALAFSVWAWRRDKIQGQPWWGGKAAFAPKDEQHLWGHLSDETESALESAKRRNGYSEILAPQDQSPSSPRPSRSGVSLTIPLAAGIPQQASGQQATGQVVVAHQDQRLQSTTAQRLATQVQPVTFPAQTTRAGMISSQEDVASAYIPRARSGFGNTDFGSSGFSSPRVVAAEELFDIQEQADFFLSLDQPEQAIEVLKNHITDNVETSALAYMDLFDIYHRTNRVTDYAELREEFNHVFNAQVPEFEQYGGSSIGLEGAPDVLRSIQDSWNSPALVQDVIEASIFRQPGQSHRPLDMLAYRELMLLYSLAKELARPNTKYAMLPESLQAASMSSLSGLPDPSDSQLDHDLTFSSSQADLLPFDSSFMQSLPDEVVAKIKASAKPVEEAAASDETVDFDLSDSELSSFTLPSKTTKF